MQKIKEQDDLSLLIDLMPEKLKTHLQKHPRLLSLNEIVLDLGYKPEIRFDQEDIRLTDFDEVNFQDLEAIIQKIGKFNTDNRAGINRTLHRISAIKNREGRIIGITCRVGRAVVGTIDIIRDIVESNKNILFLGRPGIGKTTKLRETARVLANEFHKRVIVVDTSNEIAGEGDIPHPGIGLSRRMQVPSPDKQHAVMIEAVENHMPQVIIVDEIGTQEEAQAARTIAERGVQLIATAHGYSLENLIKNPTLSDLIGGIQSVILGDDEAKLRGTQKTVLERKNPPTFDILIEMPQKDQFLIYDDLARYVDNYLRGQFSQPEIRKREKDKIKIQKAKDLETPSEDPDLNLSQLHIFPFAISSDKLQKVIREINVPATIANSISAADIALTVPSQVKNNSKINKILEGRDMPLHVIKSNTISSITKFFIDFFQVDLDTKEEEKAVVEIENICAQVVKEKKPLEADPHNAYLRKLQHEIVEKYGLNSLSIGQTINRRLRVYPK